MGCGGKQRFSLVELLVTAAIVALLLVVLLGAVQKARSVANATACLSNLRAVAVALMSYRSDNGGLPLDGLSQVLAPHGLLERSLHCPMTGHHYERFYVARRGTVYERDYLIGCPDHRDGGRALAVFDDGAVFSGKSGPVNWEGHSVLPGDLVTGGELQFEDGSVAVLSLGTRAYVAASFRAGDGVPHTIVRVPCDNGNCALDVTVAEGARFEVVTPAAIAAAGGARFRVRAVSSSSMFQTHVDVVSGRVKVLARSGQGGILGPGQSMTSAEPSGGVPRDFSPGP
ncbi:MAG: FecR protein [Lentisphaerae bacterium ADurb.BinA184]|nr:MAG: FecR protein [Lentisphaerae bacterium ADurb.BinA184]